MCVKRLMALVLLLVTTMVQVSVADSSFIFNYGFQSDNLTMDGISEINSNGLLQLTNETKLQTSHAFYPDPIVLTNTSSFSTTFVFAIRPVPPRGGHGMAFVISPTKEFPGALDTQYLGLFNKTTNGDPTNHVFAVELDIVHSSDLDDINGNHVGIDINGLKSKNSTPAGYHVNGLGFQNLSLISGLPMQVWVDYDGGKKQINVTLAPINVNMPRTPLLTLSQDLSQILKKSSYVGFSSSTSEGLVASHYVLGWSFRVNGEAQKLDTSKLPKLPQLGGKQVSVADTSFIFNSGFQSANLTMNGISFITSNGLLQLTNQTRRQTGHAFYPNPILLTNTSFSTTFVFAIRSQYQTLNGHGMAFVISPTKAFPYDNPGRYFDLFNISNNGDPKNHVLAVEFDTVQNNEFEDINDNHVGIDINGLNSTKSAPARYYVNRFQFQNLSLNSGLPMQAWVDYDGGKKQISVTIASINVNKPETPLLTMSQDLSQILTNPSYVGFSSSNGALIASHYVLGWSFQVNGEAQKLDISRLPKLPPLGRNKQSIILPIGVTLLSLCLIVLAGLSIVYYIYRKKKFSEIVEEWEQDYGPHCWRFDSKRAGGDFGRIFNKHLKSLQLQNSCG